MPTKLSILLLSSILLGVAVCGCSSNPPEPTAEQKKDFQGGPMPKDFMKEHAGGMKGGPATAPPPAKP